VQLLYKYMFIFNHCTKVIFMLLHISAVYFNHRQKACTINWTKSLANLLQISNRHNTKSHCTTTFHTQDENLTNITFNQEEFKMLELDFQYNFEKRASQFITDLIVDIKNAIWKLDPKIQNIYRHLAIKWMKETSTSSTTNVTQKTKTRS
jgi:hypothetical protein